MRHAPFMPLLALTLLLPVLSHAGEGGARIMAGWFNVTTTEGWNGRRYVDGGHVFAEEFDSSGNGQIDVWRFYRRGILTSEERDNNGDGKVDFQSRWDPREQRLVSVLRDTDYKGMNDLEIEYLSRNRWEVREDRNQDGVTDRILVVNGPPDLFATLGIDVLSQRNVVDSIPTGHWYELQSDDGFTGSITEYRRYTRGQLSHWGDWDGRKVNWRKVPPDYMPPPPTTPLPPQSVDPYYAETPVAPVTAPASTYGDSFGDPYAAGQPYQDTFVPGAPVQLDRTRYDGLPPGDSAARSLPARMRPPGGGRR